MAYRFLGIDHFPLRFALTACFALLPLLGAKTADAQFNHTFGWDVPTQLPGDSPVAEIAGYEISYGLTTRGYNTVIDAGASFNRTVAFPSNGPYFVAVRAYDIHGSRGIYSSELVVSNSGADPAPTPEPTPSPTPGLDRDSDGVPDESDNCPVHSNADQANADGDEKGDACDRGRGRYSCGGTETDPSTVALVSGGSLLSVDPSSSITKSKIFASGIPLLGNFVSERGSAALETARLARSSRNSVLRVFGRRTRDFRMPGSVGLVGLCHANNDSIADVVSVSDGTVRIDFLNGRRLAKKLFKGTVRAIACGDSSGDGIDELFVLEDVKSLGQTNRRAVSVNLRSWRITPVFRTSSAFGVTSTDLDNDGLADLCTAERQDANTLITCATGAGEMEVLAPALKNFAGGNFLVEDGRTEGSFVVLDAQGSVSLLSRTGELSPVEPVLRGTAVSLSNRTKLAVCR